MKHSESIAHLAAALVKASGTLKPVVKDATNPHFRNRYATLDAITESVRPTLAAHGLAVVQGSTMPETNEGVIMGFSLETMLVHSSGEWLSNAVYIPIEKPSAQGAGSAISYGRRYGLAALLGLTTDEDDDGETATNHAPRPQATTAAKTERVKGPAPTPAAKSGAAADFVMPFGKTKGTPLGQMDPLDLESAIKWVHDKAPGKFGDFVNAAEAVLASLGDPVPVDVADDDLPF